MIISFSAKNFRSIKKRITLSFEPENSKDLESSFIVHPKGAKFRLLKIGLIFGANASGKTTILDALDFLRNLATNPLEKKSDQLDVSPFLFDKETPKENTFFSIDFFQNEKKFRYEVTFNNKAIHKEKLWFFNPNKAVVFSRETNINQQLSIIKFGSKVKISSKARNALEANTLWNNTVLGGFIKTNIEFPLLQDATSWFEDTLHPTIQPKTNLMGFIANEMEDGSIQKSSIVSILKKADFNITDIRINSKDIPLNNELLEQLPIPDTEKQKLMEKGSIIAKELLFVHSVQGHQYELSYDDESAGTKRYFAFSGLIDLMVNNRIVLPIDELEASLHPDLLKHFLLTFLMNSTESQLIATSHFREFLLERDLFRNDCIWFTERDSDGSTDLFSLADFDTTVVRDKSSIYNAYKIGKLGATPDLKDYYMEAQ
ncbi:MAG TPA: ATP-binding protein [Saprospiraceae bacterium]|nr:ATP-binding protein [Saprospiraceae bacterium]